MTPALDGNTARTRTAALVVHGIQLAFNFFWSIAFFNQPKDNGRTRQHAWHPTSLQHDGIFPKIVWGNPRF